MFHPWNEPHLPASRLVRHSLSKISASHQGFGQYKPGRNIEQPQVTRVCEDRKETARTTEVGRKLQCHSQEQNVISHLLVFSPAVSSIFEFHYMPRGNDSMY
jgi:hypothetical protein